MHGTVAAALVWERGRESFYTRVIFKSCTAANVLAETPQFSNGSV
jgi:hypothetical protein